MVQAKKDYAASQKCGAHFISASLIIWIFICAVNLINLTQYYKNVLSLYSSALLVPLALLFSKIYKIENKINNKITIKNKCSFEHLFFYFNLVYELDSPINKSTN